MVYAGRSRLQMFMGPHVFGQCVAGLGPDGRSPHRDRVNCVEFSADGTMMFTGDGSGVVVVWSVLPDHPLKAGSYKARGLRCCPGRMGRLPTVCLCR